MDDLYNIPGDKGHPWRLNKFVEYQHEVPSIHYKFLKRWVEINNLSRDDAVMFSWYLSLTYDPITSVLLYEDLNLRLVRSKDIKRYWENKKQYLIFNSARKYVKNMDWFIPLMYEFMKTIRRQPYLWIKSLQGDSGVETYKNIFKAISDIKYVGRFAADLFVEGIIYFKEFLDIEIEEPLGELPWKSMSNLTSGLLNIFYEDEAANLYDKTGKIPDINYLEKLLYRVQKQIQKTYPEQNSDITYFITKICSFRNLFKQSRYGGFHHDRQLENLRKYEENFPHHSQLWLAVLEVREDIFPKKFLGEVGGWKGIRKERKKLWIDKGLTGVEDECQYL